MTIISRNLFKFNMYQKTRTRNITFNPNQTHQAKEKNKKNEEPTRSNRHPTSETGQVRVKRVIQFSTLKPT